jgi:hypothetical protein
MSKGQSMNRQKNIGRVVRDQRSQRLAKLKVSTLKQKSPKTHA